MRVRGLPAEFATRRSQPGTPETTAKLAKTRFVPGRTTGIRAGRYRRFRPTAVARYTELIAPQWMAAIIVIGLPQLTERRLLLCYH